jgi:hypothetical protein
MNPNEKEVVQKLYPILDDNMEELRAGCAKLMKDLLKSDYLTAECNDPE